MCAACWILLYREKLWWKSESGIASFYLVEEYRIPVVSQWRWSQINAWMMEEQSSVVIITDYNITFNLFFPLFGIQLVVLTFVVFDIFKT